MAEKIKIFERKSSEELQKFLKLKENTMTSLDWCKWAGWFDTDGYFAKSKRTCGSHLKLKDREPVELLSNTFETTLSKRTMSTITPEPYRKEYTIEVFYSGLCGDKGRWFTKNVYPYLLKEEKKEYAARLLGYKPESKNLDDWTEEEVISYFATAIDGDGNINKRLHVKNKIHIAARISSSDIEYLNNLKFLIENVLKINCGLHEHSTYKTKEGIKTKYLILVHANKLNRNLFESLSKDNVMTIPRKRNAILEYLNQ